MPALHLAGDLLLLNLSFWLVSNFYHYPAGFFYERDSGLFFIIFSNLVWFILSQALTIYDIDRTQSRFKTLKDILTVLVIHLCSISFYIVVTESNYIGRELLLTFYLLMAPAVLAARFSVLHMLRLLRRSGFNYRNVVIVGQNQRAQDLRRFFELNPEYGYRFQGFFAPKDLAEEDSLKALDALIEEKDVDEIYLSLKDDSGSYLKSLMHLAEYRSIKLKLVPDLSGISVHDIRLNYYEQLPIVSFRREPINQPINILLKRSFDVVFALAVLVLVGSWLFPLIALLIRINSRGPIFFRQRRSGLNGAEFLCWKFRTMYVNEQADTRQATRNDSRITPIGRFLRRTNLDELPQFINVLLGDMSVVGPRPHMIKHTEQYSQLIDNYMIRHLIKPGVTGLAQVMGYRGETRDDWEMKGRVKLDIFYIENWSFWLDLRVVYLTVSQMVRGDEKAF